MTANSISIPPNANIRFATKPGDLGWVVMAHGEIYSQLGWDSAIEYLTARIVADYANNHDASREAAWIAEYNGNRVGCIFCVKDEKENDTAKLRLLLLSPEARGLKLGARLVDTCIDFARTAGYKRIALWTNDVLTTARKIYKKAGFTLVNEEKHNTFGHEMTGQNWVLELE